MTALLDILRGAFVFLAAFAGMLGGMIGAMWLTGLPLGPTDHARTTIAMIGGGALIVGIFLIIATIGISQMGRP